MRALDYLRVGSKNLQRARLRSGLTLIALTISTVILVTMAAISIGGRSAIVNQLSPGGSLTSIAVTPNQSTGAVSLFGSIQHVNQRAAKLDDTVVTQLSQLPHVQRVIPEEYIWEFNNFTVSGTNQQFVAQAYGIPDGSVLQTNAGTTFKPNDSRHVVVLGLAYAESLGYSHEPQELVGKTIQITTQKGYRGDGANIPGPTATEQVNEQFNQSTTTLQATVIGITTGGSNQNNMFIPMNWARSVRTINYWVYDADKAAHVSNGSPSPDQIGDLKSTDQISTQGYTTLSVSVDNVANVRTVVTSISNLGFGVVSTLQAVERLQQFSTAMWVMFGAVAVIAVVAATLGVVNTMLMVATERRYVIGVWRACGATRGLIVRQFLLEAGILGFVGGVLGSGLGLGVVHYINRYITELLKAQNINLSITNIATAPPLLLVGVIGLTTLFGTLAGLYPAYRAGRQDPAEMLRVSDG
ncbi:MAG TPA: ABC transporter permease [Verrucomicrobiae bacterium]|nr:ABC transporter permease [Verrucomicrobiae bacterium]